MNNILVIDGNSILNRAFYGIKQNLSTPDGKPTGAIYGLLNTVTRHIAALKPSYAAIAFDLHAPTFRKKMYDAYKAGRHETPPELLMQFDGAKECMSALGLHVLTLEGYEADDILGTVAEYANTNPDLHAYVLSGDRDLLQLITDKVTVLLTSNTDTLTFDEKAFTDKYAISPNEYVFAKALMGDHSDNIPGVAGIGEKTAMKLIGDYHTLDGVYDNLPDAPLSAKTKEKLENGKSDAYLSLTLSAIVKNAPINRSLDSLSYAGYNDQTLLYTLKKYHFYALIRKLGLDKITPDNTVPSITTDKSTITDIETDTGNSTSDICNITASEYYEISPAQLKEYTNGKDIAIDISFPDEKTGDPTLFVTVKDNGKDNNLYKNYTVPYVGTHSSDSLENTLAKTLENAKSVTVYDAKRLYHILDKYSVTVKKPFLDVMLSSYVADSRDGRMTPSELAKKYLSLAENDEKAPSYTYLLMPLDSAIRKSLPPNGSDKLLDEVEIPLALTLFYTEKNGFKVDISALNRFGDRLKEKSAQIEEEIYSLAGERFNISSPKQLGDILFEKLGLPHGKKTKSGYSTNADVLQSLRAEHPIINLILEYRQLTKLVSTYVVGLTDAADANSRVHTDFRQALTATGRLSSSEPNLQNIPVRTPLGREMRAFFVADDGNVLVDADYSQIELRLLAAMSGDENMTEAFISGADIHTRTAAAVFNIPETFVTEDLRKRAKAVNFGIVYGISAFSLAGDLGISTKEAKQYIESYFSLYPKIDGYLKRLVDEATKLGYTQTLFGRRRYISELSSPNAIVRALGKRIAMNSPIQGTAADIMKIAMVRVHNRLSREVPSAKLIMQVHDELIVECPAEVQKTVSEILTREMQSAATLSVPLTADVSSGTSWLI